MSTKQNLELIIEQSGEVEENTIDARKKDQLSQLMQQIQEMQKKAEQLTYELKGDKNEWLQDSLFPDLVSDSKGPSKRMEIMSQKDKLNETGELAIRQETV